MRLEGSYSFDAPQHLVWEMLLDPDVLANIMPGCEKLEQTGADEYQGKMRIKMGPVQSTFQGKVTLSDLTPPESKSEGSYTMQVSGTGPAGIVDGVGGVRLEADGDKTIMHYAGDANVSGRIASVGQRVMDTSARAIVKQSLDNLNSQIQIRLEPAPEPEAVAPAEPPAPEAKTAAPGEPAPTMGARVEEIPEPSQAEFAFSIARELFYEFVPEDKRSLVLVGTGLFALYLFFNWWTNLIARRVAKQLQKGT